MRTFWPGVTGLVIDELVEADATERVAHLLQDCDGLRRLRIDELRTEVAAGLDPLDRGEGLDGDAVIDEILSDEPCAG